MPPCVFQKCCLHFKWYIPILELPGKPEITGTPAGPVIAGTTVKLVCTSRGSSPDTQLHWYAGGRLVDSSYSRADGYVINEYEFTAAGVGMADLECRLRFAPTGLEQSASASIFIVGKAILILYLAVFSCNLCIGKWQLVD